MKSNHFYLFSLSVLAAATLLNGCATGPKNMQPVQVEPVKVVDVVQQPELEPEWADFIKANYPEWKNHYWVDRGQWGNRGYLVGKAPSAVEPPVNVGITPLPATNIVVEPPTIVAVEPPVVAKPEVPTTYTVKKGDSLWRIAGKVYGNPLKWGRIYRANKDKIANPNKIRVGQVLSIP